MVLVDWLVNVMVGVQLNGPLKYVAEIILYHVHHRRRERNVKGNSYELLAVQE